MHDQAQLNRSYFYMIACAVLWSTSGFFIKAIPWNPLVIAGARSLIAIMVLLVYMRWTKVRYVISRTTLMAGFFLTCNFFLFVSANKLTTAANAIVLQYTSPIFIMIISALFLNQKFKKGDLVAVAATILGISLLFFDQLSQGYLLGNLLAILGGIAMACLYVIAGNTDDDSRMSGILNAHILATMIGIPCLILFPVALTPVSVASILGLGVIQIGIPYILYGLAARRISPLACNLIATLEILLNPVWVFLSTGEKPGLFALIGASTVMISVIAWCVWSSKAE